MRRIMSKEGGFTYAWTALLFTFVVFPLVLLSLQFARMTMTKHALQNAADAASEAAAASVDLTHFQATGEIRLTSDVYSVAQAYAMRNAGSLPSKGIMPKVVSIVPDDNNQTVRVDVAATVSGMFGIPATVVASGTAKVRAITN